nr:translation initiation factor IF-2-like isoform X1 [Anser cygnoides]XP_047907982.1 translation initiation factor IF-2-like isoform X2 [Anser cygnoides]
MNLAARERQLRAGRERPRAGPQFSWRDRERESSGGGGEAPAMKIPESRPPSPLSGRGTRGAEPAKPSSERCVAGPSARPAERRPEAGGAPAVRGLFPLRRCWPYRGAGAATPLRSQASGPGSAGGRRGLRF